MSAGTQIDFSKYAAPQVDFSKYEQPAAKHDDTPAPPSFLNTLGREVKSMNPIPMAEGMYKAFTEPPSKAEADKHGTDFFGLGIDRMLVDPAKYAAKWYLDAVRGKVPNAYEQALSVAPEAIGQSAGGAVAAKAIGSAVSAAPGVPALVKGAIPAIRSGTATALDTAADVVHPDLVGVVSPRLAHLQRLAGRVADVIRPAAKSSQPAPSPIAPSSDIYPVMNAAERPAPNQQAIPQAQASPVQAQATAVAAQGPERTFDARPTSRAEITDDKAVEDKMRFDLEQHGWRALSEERQKYYADNGPQYTKSQLIANTQARVVMDNALRQAQSILDQQKISAEVPAKYTKTVTPKAPVAASSVPEAVTQSLDPNSDLTDILQRSLDAIKARKAGK